MTNYLSDEKETLKHEKILEEQLIKDFELMGNEVELVDDSYHQRASGAQPQAAPGCLRPSAPEYPVENFCQTGGYAPPAAGQRQQDSGPDSGPPSPSAWPVVLMDVEGK